MDKLLQKLNIYINPDVFCHVAEYAVEECQVHTPNGIIVISDMIFAGLKHGSCKEWAVPKDVHILERSEEYFLDEKHGTSYSWKDGILRHIEQYSKGVLHGKSQYFHCQLDQFEEKTYSRGELIELKKYGKSGMVTHKILFPNMQLVELCNIVDGHTISSYTYDPETNVYTITRFNNDNFIDTIQNIKNGLLHGEYTEYYHNSDKKRRVANFIEGKEHGESVVYHRNGIIAEIKNYQYGRAHGKMREYNSDNALTLECSYFGGYLNGTSKEYLEGRVIEDCYYVDGKLHGTFIQTSGDTVTVCNYNMGKLNGLYTMVVSGVTKKQINYSNGMLHGEYMTAECCYTTYESYRHGLLHGTSKTVSKKFTYIINFENGLKHGRAELYHNNELIRIVEYRMNIIILKQIISPHTDYYACSAFRCAFHSNHKFDGLKN